MHLSINHSVDTLMGMIKQLPIAKKMNAFATVGDRELINFVSNDYLGLSDNKELKECVKSAIDVYGLGATGSRRLSGNHQLCLDVEAHIAKWVGKESGVLFNSGYQMNCAIFSTLVLEPCLILTDKLIHASIIDGIKNSGVQLVRFRHNDVTHLGQLLAKHAHHKKHVIIVCESIYSMDGDMSPLHDIISLKKQYNATLIVDEAHSIGLYGECGNGWVNECNGIRDVDVVLLAFGKSFGLSGAMLLSTESVVELIKAKCRSYIYSTAMPLPVVCGIKKASEIIADAGSLIEQLRSNIKTFKKTIATNSCTQIQPIIFKERQNAERLEAHLLENGFLCRSVHAPTVPKSRLRITLTAKHTSEQINMLTQTIGEWME